MNHDHEFVRYVQRMVGRKIYYQALCSCKWRSLIVGSRGASWNDWNAHRYLQPGDLLGGSTEALETQAGLKQALTGQEP